MDNAEVFSFSFGLLFGISYVVYSFECNIDDALKILCYDLFVLACLFDKRYHKTFILT